MIVSKKSALGNVTRSRTALAVVAATVVFGGGISEASAKGRHHHAHHHHGYHHHHARNAPEGAQASAEGHSWLNANASMGPVSGGGRSFSGMAS